ncbi:hypothetical protein [Vulcanisaeta sp. JCM 16161]|uniref:hypothetical protein n=1 Tax=Vulcanisaeta sp. JCM 16161 TaxID=1295372 RepID=UPI001FB47C16|nr:hypothetical protein [Vulcanisaeta sp. JCM 16161]
MRCATLLLREVGALEVCIYGDRIREVRVRVGVDGIRESAIGQINEVLLKYIMGLVEPREIIKYLELSRACLVWPRWPCSQYQGVGLRPMPN